MPKAIFATAAGVFLGSGLVYAAYIHGPDIVVGVLSKFFGG